MKREWSDKISDDKAASVIAFLCGVTAGMISAALLALAVRG